MNTALSSGGGGGGGIGSGVGDRSTKSERCGVFHAENESSTVSAA